ncbi:hypothetical protein [uncultured Bifidobacterium sp.]|uniref:hypothetical protein n=1 Tax=uncultured Bifidobacterium sp. TaxID=165187 RepID=UPI00262F7FB4|nr:hypothetical protein [uncultured Bifidobacterium sp.]
MSDSSAFTVHGDRPPEGSRRPDAPTDGRPLSSAPSASESLRSDDNLATEIVHGVPETVEVSRHPDASIGDSDLSLAEMGRRRAHPAHWIVYGVGVLLAIILPYWLGRLLAARRTDWLVSHMPSITVEGVALVSWLVTVIMFAGLGLAIVESSRWLWRIVFVLGLAAEQFIAGLGLLKFDFWHSAYVIYGSRAQYANAADIGIMAAGFAMAFYAVLFVGLLVVIPKRSKLNVLTRSWMSFILFFVIEVLAYLIVVLSGLLHIF